MHDIEKGNCMANTVKIRNCKNIDEATISIETGKLNVKFAPNGTGKTALSDGLRFGIEKDSNIGARIVPFKCRNIKEPPFFEIEGIDDIKSIAVFDDEYVRNVVYVGSKFFPESFDVFIKTPAYLNTIEEIEKRLDAVTTAIGSIEVTGFISTLETLVKNTCGGGGLNTEGRLKANAPSLKAMSKGNFQKEIPSEYQSLRSYIESSSFAEWAKWHKEGELLAAENDRCPFCGESIVESRVGLLAVKDRYPSANVSHYDKFASSLNLSMEYFGNETGRELAAILDSRTALNSQQQGCLSEVVIQANRIIKSFSKAKELSSYFQLAAIGDNIENAIDECKISLSLLVHFNSDACTNVLSEYNSALDEVKKKSRELFGIVASQKKQLARALQGRESEINSFLSSGGYPYAVKIVANSASACKVELVHCSNFALESTDGALSFGERNALALVFFMYSVQSNNPDLIVLDDPITSFDGRKRYAILNMLFLKEGGSPCLKDKTVLLLTHEYQVVFDIEHTKRRAFQPLASTTLIINRDSNVTEEIIEAKDMIPVRRLFESLVLDSKEILVRLAYCRRIAELDEDRGLVWDALSSLFHHKKKPSQRNNEPLSEEELEEACSEISKQISCNFNYEEQLTRLTNPSEARMIFEAVGSNYEKLQIARLALDGENIDRATKKVLDETLHIDNGFIYQLDPRKFDLISDTLIEKCALALDKLSAS